MFAVRCTARYTVSDDFTLTEDFCRQHFLVGLTLQEVRAALVQVVQVRRAAITILRDMLAKHELDDRCQMKVKETTYKITDL